MANKWSKLEKLFSSNLRSQLICSVFLLQFQLLASALFKSGSDFTALGKYSSVDYSARCPSLEGAEFWCLLNETSGEMFI